MAKMIPLYSLSSHAEIEQRARLLFELAGRPTGCDLEIWLRAESEYHAAERPVSSPVFQVNEPGAK